LTFMNVGWHCSLGSFVFLIYNSTRLPFLNYHSGGLEES
jgi:hypothetical protein